MILKSFITPLKEVAIHHYLYMLFCLSCDWTLWLASPYGYENHCNRSWIVGQHRCNLVASSQWVMAEHCVVPLLTNDIIISTLLWYYYFCHLVYRQWHNDVLFHLYACMLSMFTNILYKWYPDRLLETNATKLRVSMPRLWRWYF